jgi:stearoyl-CoA desaturase (delta-9 desaturase)
MVSTKKIKWLMLPFLTLTVLGTALGLVIYIPTYGIHPLEPIYFGISVYGIAWVVSSGYHRYFSHKAFTCHPLLKIFFLITGCAALQQSALVWASDHRMHHRFVDTEKDPYNIKKGFWWAHIGWIFADDPQGRSSLLEYAPDLAKDKWVLWQNKYWIWIALPLTVGLPLALGIAIDRPFGMLLWGALLRVVVTHHTTFTINSIAHYFGTQPYSDDNSSKDVWWLGPFLCGENYHNYHHSFPGDYRNGIRWYHWDPSKWVLWSLSKIGLVGGLRRVAPSLILKARLDMDMNRVQQKLQPAPLEIRAPLFNQAVHLRKTLEEAAELYAKARTSYDLMKKDWAKRSRQSLKEIEINLNHQKQRFHELAKEWKELLQVMSRQAAYA